MEKTTFAHQMEAEALSLLETLVTIPAPSGKEEARALYLKSYLAKKGLAGRVDEAGNLLYAFGDGREGYVVFAAHLDTVFTDENLVVKKDGNLWRCPGIGDDTANVVHLLCALLFAKDHWQEGMTNLLFVFNTGEEGLGNLKGTRRLFDDYRGRIQSFLSFDLYCPHLYHIPVGSHRYAITLKTKGGHSFNDFGSANAILEASRLIDALSKAPLLEEKTTWNFGGIEGGTSINAIASSCTFLYEYRAISERELQRMEAFFLKTLEEHRRPTVTITYEDKGKRPAMGEVDPKALERLQSMVSEKVLETYGKETIWEPLSSDANIPLSLGIPALTVGTVVGGDCHRQSEWVDATSIKDGITLAVSLVEAFLS